MNRAIHWFNQWFCAPDRAVVQRYLRFPGEAQVTTLNVRGVTDAWFKQVSSLDPADWSLETATAQCAMLGAVRPPTR
jgi:hypothetical protein